MRCCCRIPAIAHCPANFKAQATEILTAVRQRPESDAELRHALLWFIGAFANWDMSAHPTYLQVGRNLVQAAHGEEAPLVADPFAGGGSIPLEALRLGCEAFASDLNPVACLILKVMLEDIPRHGPKLADELRRVGAEIKAAAQKELADLYPADPDGATPIAYLWARTVRCEAPNCGAEIPLMRSFWLCKKAKRKRALRYQVQRPAGETPHVEFEVFEPRADGEVANGTVTRARATCLCCAAVLPPERVRAQLAAERGGAGRGVRRGGPARRRRAPDGGGDAPPGRERPPLPPADAGGLLRRTQWPGPGGGGAGRVGARRQAGAVSSARRADCRRLGRSGVPCAALRHVPVGRSVHCAAEGGAALRRSVVRRRSR